MSSPRRTITLTADNFCDYLPTDYAESLVTDFAIGPGGIGAGDAIVDKFRAWLAWESSWALDVWYEMSRPDAAAFLQVIAIRPDSLWE